MGYIDVNWKRKKLSDVTDNIIDQFKYLESIMPPETKAEILYMRTFLSRTLLICQPPSMGSAAFLGPLDL